MRPTGLVAGALGGAAVLNVLARVNGSPWLSLAAAATLTLPTAGLLYAPRLSGLTLARDVPGRVRSGADVVTVLTVANTGRRVSSPARVSDPAGGLSPVAVAVPALPPGGQVELRLPRAAGPRGVHDLPPVTVTGTDPFGMFRAARTVELPGRVIVHPARVRSGPVRLGLRAGAGAAGQVPQPGVGTEILGLRPWRPGDGAQSVSARASARHSSAWVLERERDTGPALVVLAGVCGDGPAWEQAVAEVCAAAQQVPEPDLRGRAAAERGPQGVADWFAALSGGVPAGRDGLLAAVRACGQDGTLVLLSSGADPALTAAAGACRAARVRLWMPYA